MNHYYYDNNMICISGDNTANYITTLAFFSCASCVTLMLKFGRFKTSFNVQFNGNRKSGKGHENYSSSNSINGAYRTNRDELFSKYLLYLHIHLFKPVKIPQLKLTSTCSKLGLKSIGIFSQLWLG